MRKSVNSEIHKKKLSGGEKNISRKPGNTVQMRERKTLAAARWVTVHCNKSRSCWLCYVIYANLHDEKKSGPYCWCWCFY